MTGADYGIITQASMATAIKKLLKKDGLFRSDDFFEDNIQEQVLIEYFKAVRKVYKHAWLNETHILCKTSGVSALISVFIEIIQDLYSKKMQLTDKKGLSIDQNTFIPYFKKLKDKDFTFEAKEVGSKYLGSGGAKSLSDDIISIVIRK